MRFSENYIRTHFCIFFYFLVSATSFAQNDQLPPEKAVQGKDFKRDTIPTLDLAPDTTKEESTLKGKKKKKRIFYGLKCKKGFTRTGKKDKMVVETFYYLKKYKAPNPYIKDIYVWDIKARKVIAVSDVEEHHHMFLKILHGPYTKTVGKEIVEQGIFYVGTKHARWEKYGKNFVLIDKAKYHKGWLRDAEIVYYDAERKKIKEVVPIKHGVLHGEYYYFLENGQVQIFGKYRDGKKVGTWIEYFKNKNKRKKETSYPRDPHIGDQFEPFTLNEWAEDGTPLIRDGKPVTNQMKKGSKKR